MAFGDERAWKYKSYESTNGMDQSGLLQLQENLGGPDYDTDRDWHARTVRYGEGWAYDPTYSHYKRAKPTHTDPEDGVNVDPSMPVGSMSKTYNLRKDGRFWKQDSGQDWAQSSSPSTHWRPKMRYEKNYSSVAGDTSEATAMHNLGSITESDGDIDIWSTNRKRFRL